jgi:hypothetical protein
MAGEYVVRGMETPDVGTLVATLNRAFSSVVPSSEQAGRDAEQPLSSAALVSPLQSSLPLEQRLLDSVPSEGKPPPLDKDVQEKLKAIKRRSAGSVRPADVVTSSDILPATQIAGSAVPAPRADTERPRLSTQEQRAQIEQVLRRYELAYRNLDAGVAKTVWPALDERTLSRAFAGLSWQEVRFDRCVIHLSSPDAEAVCTGIATYLAKGSREPRSEQRRWTFQLMNADDAWTIVGADARQDDRP